MKTYEIKMNRSRWMSLLIAVLCIAVIITLCTPYFTYGKTTSTYVRADGDAEILYGKTWVISGVEEGADGYQKIEVSKDGSNSAVYTTNVLRVNQLNAKETYEAALKNYNDMAANEEACEIVVAKCDAMVKALAASGADTTAAQKKLDDANKYYNVAKTQRENAKAALDNALTAVQKAYSVDASFALVSVDKNAEYSAIFAAYPEEYKQALATVVRQSEFKTMVSEKYAAEYAEFAKTTSKKPVDKFYEKKMAEISASEKSALYNEFAASQAEIDSKEIADAGSAIMDILTAKMSAADVDEQINGKLNDMKTVSAEAAAMTAAAKKGVDASAKDGASKNTVAKAEKDIDAIVKELTAANVASDEILAAEYTATAIERASKPADYDKMVAAQNGEALMKTEASVKYNKGKLTIKFANGEEKVTTFAPAVSYDSEKTISVLGYVGFPYNAEEFSAEMAHNIKDYKINNVVVLPIAIGVLALLGIGLCIIKKDSYISGICPAAAGLVGIIGYLTSDFMKLGNNFTAHIIVFAIVFVFGAIQLVLGLKEKKN